MSSTNFKIRSIRYNLVMNIILKTSSFIFPLISFPYVSRILGATGNGKIAFATSIIYYFSTFACLGIPTYGVKVCAQYRDNLEKLNKVVKELLIISTIMLILSYATLFILIEVVPKLKEEKLLLIISSFSIILTVYGVEWFYQGIEQYDYITFRNIAFKIIAVILMFLFVKDYSDYINYCVITVIGTAGSNIFNIIRLKKLVNFKVKEKLNLKMHVKPIVILFMLSAASMIYTSLDSVMLGFMTTDTEVGYYNAAIKIKNILVSFVTALGAVLLPRISYHIQKGELDQFYKLIKQSFNFVFLISVPISNYLFLFAKESIDLLAGSGYENAILPLQLVIYSVCFIGLTNIIGIQIFVPQGKELYTVFSTIVGAIINIVLNYFFIIRFKAAGSGFATTIAELSVLCVQIYFIKNEWKAMIEIKNILKILIINSVIFVFGYFSYRYLIFDQTIITLAISSIVYFGLYLVLLLIFKEEIVSKYVKKFKKIKINMENK